MKKRFRFYDRASKQMIYPYPPTKGDKMKYGEGVLSIGLTKFKVSDISEPMMFTGLLDKNKNQIWEDDYIETEYGIMQVFFIDGRFILMWADGGTFYEQLYDVHNSIEVSGNKYEHSISTSTKIIKNKKS